MLRSVVQSRAWAILFLLLLPVSTPARAADSRAFAICSDFQTGTVGAVDLSTRVVSQDVASVNADAIVRWYGGLLYVVNRFLGDNIQVLDPAQGYAVLRQFSTGDGSNPQDIVFVSPTKAYVTRYASADLLIVDPSSPSGTPQSSISLASFADSDGLPEMARMIRIGRYLFVACQRLTNFAASNASVVVVVDTQTDAVVDVNPGLPGVQGITLQLRNPVTSFEYARSLGRLWIGCAGSFGALDGGIEAIDPFTFTTLGPAITEQTLGGDLADVLWDTPTHAYALTGQALTNQLVSWNPETGMKIATVFTGNGGFSLPDMESNDRGELYVCKNPSPASSSDPPGLLVFSTSSGALLAGPLSTGLPPVSVTFDRATDEVTAVANEPRAGGLSLLGPWPNPARGSTRLSLRLPEEADVELAVLDGCGRRVRSIASGRQSAGERSWIWDLKDAQGQVVAPGLYFVQARVGERTSARRLAVIR